MSSLTSNIAADDSWLNIKDDDTRDLLRRILDRLDNIDVRGSGVVIPAGFITDLMLAGAISSSKYGAGSIPATAYQDLSITLNKLAVGILAANATGQAKMAAAYILNAHLSLACVGTLNYQLLSVTAAIIADLNVTPQKLSAPLAAAIQGTPAFTIGVETANIIRVTVQLKDSNGVNLAVPCVCRAWLSDAAGGAVTAVAPSVGTVIGTVGIVIDSIAANKHLIVASNASGVFDLDVKEAAAKTWYLNIEYAGKLFSSGAITFV